MTDYMANPLFAQCAEARERQAAFLAIAEGDYNRGRLENDVAAVADAEQRILAHKRGIEDLDKQGWQMRAQIDQQIAQQEHQRKTAGLSETGQEMAKVVGMSNAEYALALQAKRNGVDSETFNKHVAQLKESGQIPEGPDA